MDKGDERKGEGGSSEARPNKPKSPCAIENIIIVIFGRIVVCVVSGVFDLLIRILFPQ